jgi:hypothetical protein
VLSAGSSRRASRAGAGAADRVTRGA